MQDYLTSQDQAIVSVNEGPGNTFGGKRDNPRQLFTFAEAAEDVALEDSYEELNRKLFVSYKKQVPGFDVADKPHSTIVDKYANDMSSKGHKVLVKPDAYNVSVLLKPTMSFLQRLREVFPN